MIMSKIRITLLLIITIILFSPTVNLRNRIVGGNDVLVSDFPYQCGLSHTPKPAPICGCAIISATRALTAAHCTQVQLKYYIFAGIDHLNGTASVRFVSHIVSHPKFIQFNNNYDIAVLFFHKLVIGPNIRPAKLPSFNQRLPVRRKGRVSGWGLTSDGGRKGSDELRATEVPILSETECNEDLKTVITMTKQMFCAGFQEGGHDACQGDSGGPFVVDGILYGLVSFGIGCANQYSPGVYTNVAAVRKFIKCTAGV